MGYTSVGVQTGHIPDKTDRAFADTAI